MKKIKLFAGVLFAFALVIGMSVAAFAYDYTVTVSGGDGKVDGSEMIIVADDVKLGGSVALPGADKVIPNDSKYVFKGYYISGQEGTLFTTTYAGVDGKGIQKDTDLVAAYGVPGDMYKYTVNYVNQATGAPLHDPEVFYANAGDNLVVVYRYVEGFLPTTYSQSRTISTDTSKNVFTFEYNPAPTSEVIVIDEGGAGGAGAPAAPAAPGAGGGAGGGGNQPAGGGGEEIEPEPTPLGPGGGGEEIETEPAPLGPGGESQPEPGPGPEPGKPGSALPWAIGGGAAVVIAAAIGIIVGVKKKKK